MQGNRSWRFAVFAVGALIALPAMAKIPLTSAAPPGDETKVATRIIKANFPQCKSAKYAVRRPDGTIWARCNGDDFWIFILNNPKDGKSSEIAMNCTAAKKLTGIDCK